MFQHMTYVIYGHFTDGDSVNSIEVCEEIHGNSDNSDVIVLWKLNKFIFLKGQHSETTKLTEFNILSPVILN